MVALNSDDREENPGPPLSEQQLQFMIAQINNSMDLPRRDRPIIPVFSPSVSAVSRIRAIQKFVESFEYNYTGTNFFDITGVRDNTSVTRILDISRRIIAEAVPIKCVEASYLGLALTQQMHDIVRVPLIFYSTIDGHRYGHIVLAVRVEGKFGAVGLSRRHNLMYKEPVYNSMYDLILEYKASYAKWGHEVAKIKIGPCLPHDGDTMVGAVIEWSKFVTKVKDNRWDIVEEQVGKYMRSCLRQVNFNTPKARVVGPVANVHLIKRQRLLKQQKGNGNGGSGNSNNGKNDSDNDDVDGGGGSNNDDDDDDEDNMVNSSRKQNVNDLPKPSFLGV